MALDENHLNELVGLDKQSSTQEVFRPRIQDRRGLRLRPHPDLLPSPYSKEALDQPLNSAELWSRIGIDRVFAVPTWVVLYDCQARIAITFSAVHRARVNKVDVVERKRFADGRVAAVDPGNAPLNRKC